MARHVSGLLKAVCFLFVFAVLFAVTLSPCPRAFHRVHGAERGKPGEFRPQHVQRQQFQRR